MHDQHRQSRHWLPLSLRKFGYVAAALILIITAAEFVVGWCLHKNLARPFTVLCSLVFAASLSVYARNADD